jgi:pilus assembly protein CpaB
MWAANTYIEKQTAAAEAKAKGQFPMIQVVVPMTNLDRGTVISNANVVTRDVPGEFVPADVITPDRFDVAKNQRLAHPVSEGRPLLWSHLEGGQAPSFSGRLPPGMRAITVPVDEINSISGFLQPKDKIDLILTLNRDGRRETFPLLQQVLVLATGGEVIAERLDETTGQLITETFRTVTLQATQEDAKKIILAQDAGRLTAVLRHPDDKAQLPRERITVANLIGEGTKKRPVPKQGPQVQFIIGGR